MESCEESSNDLPLDNLTTASVEDDLIHGNLTSSHVLNDLINSEINTNEKYKCETLDHRYCAESREEPVAHETPILLFEDFKLSKKRKTEETQLFKCQFSGCNAKFLQYCDVQNHHQSPFKCAHIGCLTPFLPVDHRVCHRDRRKRRRPFKCDYRECKETFRKFRHLHYHKGSHPGMGNSESDKVLKCAYN